MYYSYNLKIVPIIQLETKNEKLLGNNCVNNTFYRTKK
jgi:hypothetical protein